MFLIDVLLIKCCRNVFFCSFIYYYLCQRIYSVLLKRAVKVREEPNSILLQIWIRRQECFSTFFNIVRWGVVLFFNRYLGII